MSETVGFSKTVFLVTTNALLSVGIFLAIIQTQETAPQALKVGNGWNSQSN